MNNYSSLKVFYNNVLVGTLARTADYRVAFEYDDDWIIKGFSISPLSLPLEKRVKYKIDNINLSIIAMNG